MPRVKVSRLPRIESRPRRSVNWPMACGDASGPVSRSDAAEFGVEAAPAYEYLAAAR